MTDVDPWERSQAVAERMAAGRPAVAAAWEARRVRMNELTELYATARKQHSAAKGLLTRARRDGDAEKIRLAAEREREASRRSTSTGDWCLERMFALNHVSLAELADSIDDLAELIKAQREAMDEWQRKVTQ